MPFPVPRWNQNLGVSWGSPESPASATAKCAGSIETHWGFSSATYSQYIYTYIIQSHLRQKGAL